MFYNFENFISKTCRGSFARKNKDLKKRQKRKTQNDKLNILTKISHNLLFIIDMQHVLLVGMVQTALTIVVQTATVVTDLTEAVSLNVSLDGKEDTAKMVGESLSKLKYIHIQSTCNRGEHSIKL